MSGRLWQWMAVQPGERRAVCWGALYIFFTMQAYYLLRPLRDALGVSGGLEHLPWLFSATLVAMLVLHVPFSYLTSRWPAQRFIAYSTRFFMLNLLLFAAGLWWLPPARQGLLGVVFFVWVSVFNLFVVSVFWTSVADTFSAGSAKRLFPLFAASATVGALCGALVAAQAVQYLGIAVLLALSALCLEAGRAAMLRLLRHAPAAPAPVAAVYPEGGAAPWSGWVGLLRSRYLTLISLNMVIYSVLSTLLYFQVAAIAHDQFRDAAQRTHFFALMDTWVNLATLLVQLFITGQLAKRLSLNTLLAVQPVVSGAGFLLAAALPLPAVFMSFSASRRALNFALAKPMREVLFTVVARHEKYRVKNLIDTFLYRLGDQLGSWSWAGLYALGVSSTHIARWCAVPLCLISLVASLWLGRQHERQVAALSPPPQEYA